MNLLNEFEVTAIDVSQYRKCYIVCWVQAENFHSAISDATIDALKGGVGEFWKLTAFNFVDLFKVKPAGMSRNRVLARLLGERGLWMPNWLHGGLTKARHFETCLFD